MCLTTKQKWPKIAWKPIKVYKVIYGYPNNYRTMYQRMSVDIGQTYQETIHNIFRNIEKNRTITGKRIFEIYFGLHSFQKRYLAEAVKDYYSCLYNTHVIECTIPKFSFYWIGDRDDIVSNKLKYVKIL